MMYTFHLSINSRRHREFLGSIKRHIKYNGRMTYRPRELEREPDGVAEARQGGIRAEVNHVLAENGRHDVAVRARRRRVDLHLVLLQADPEPRLAYPRALARLGRAAGTALAQAILAVLVHKRL